MHIEDVVTDAQYHLISEGIDGWLMYDYGGANPIFWDAVGHIANVTRPCWLWIPSKGEPKLLVSYVDHGRFVNLGISSNSFSGRNDMVIKLKCILKSARRVAMEYSPDGAIPRVSRVDAGVLELVRGLGIEVVQSADTVQYATQRWSEEQLASHNSAASKLNGIVRDAFGYVGERLNSGVTEHDVAELIRSRFVDSGLQVTDGPVVAVNGHSADPHFEPTASNTSVITHGDWLLIDLWSRLEGENSMFADITWTAYVGDVVPKRHQHIFDVVTKGRDLALETISTAFVEGRELQGWEVDKVARDYIEIAGYGNHFSHRLGHSLGRDVHSNAVNLDSWETLDTRKLIPGIAVTIEPGIYLSDFGVRSEIDVYLSEYGPQVTTEVQKSVVLISPQ